MPFDGNGIYTPIPAPNFPAVSGTTITASQYNLEIYDIAGALSNCLTRDGQGAPTSNISWNNFKITGLGPGTNPSDAVNKSQMDTAIASEIDTNVLASAGYLTAVKGLIGIAGGPSTATFICNFLRMRDAAGNTQTRAGGTLTLDLTLANQANGRDQAGNFNAQWVHAYAIWGLGPGLKCIASASVTAPTLPAGYTEYAYLSPIRVSASNNVLVTFYMRGDRVVWPHNIATIGPGVGTSINASTAYPMTNLSVYTPPNGLLWYARIILTAIRTGGGGYTFSATMRDDNNGTQFEQNYHVSNGNPGVAQGNTARYTLPITGGNFSLVTDAACTWQANTAYFACDGFTFYGNGAC